MKKLVSILLALAMILCLSTAAFADTTKVDITNPTVGDTADRDYYGYKILDLSTSHKEDGHGVTCPQKDNPDAPHDDNCFNYRYTFNDKFKAILQQEVVKYATAALWIANDMVAPADADAVTETHVLVYLSSMTSDGGSHAGTLRAVADRIYRAIQDASIDEDEELATGENTLNEQGYWLIADVTDGLENYDAHSLVILDTKADSHITLNPKVALPVVEKKVKDIDDSENADITDLEWKDSADHDIDANTIPFKLTATLPSNVDSYETYQMIFHDTMDAGLTLIPESFKFYLYSTKNIADGDNNMDDCLTGAPVFDTTTDLENENFLVTVNPADGHAFDVTVKNVKNLGDTKTFNAIVVTYEATLNAGATIGATGNKNTVQLEFSNDPYGNGTGTTEKDTVKVFTYELQIDKKDAHGHDLAGATFELYKFSKVDDVYVKVGNTLGGADSTLTSFNWKGLDDGTYILKEVAAPEGFNKMEDIHFAITAAHTDGAEPELREFKSEVMGTGDPATGKIVKEVVNYTGTVLPSTGAKGTVMLITAGTVLVVLAAVFMITRKKMSIYED